MGTSISSILQVTTAATAVAPGPATALIASNITTASLQLSWAAPTTGNKPYTYTPQYQLPGATAWIPFSRNCLHISWQCRMVAPKMMVLRLKA